MRAEDEDGQVKSKCCWVLLMKCSRNAPSGDDSSPAAMQQRCHNCRAKRRDGTSIDSARQLVQARKRSGTGWKLKRLERSDWGEGKGVEAHQTKWSAPETLEEQQGSGEPPRRAKHEKQRRSSRWRVSSTAECACSDHELTTFSTDLYFLITDFLLRESPCQSAALALRQEIVS